MFKFLFEVAWGKWISLIIEVNSRFWSHVERSVSVNRLILV
jgi:hypothetical protein